MLWSSRDSKIELLRGGMSADLFLFEVIYNESNPIFNISGSAFGEDPLNFADMTGMARLCLDLNSDTLLLPAGFGIDKG